MIIGPGGSSKGFYTKSGAIGAYWKLDLVEAVVVVGILVHFGSGLADQKNVRSKKNFFFNISRLRKHLAISRKLGSSSRISKLVLG